MICVDDELFRESSPDNLFGVFDYAKAVSETPGGWVPRNIEHMLMIYGNRHSDEYEVKKRSKENNGDGSDALQWGYARYCSQWLHDKAVVEKFLHKDLTSIPFDLALQDIDDAYRMEREDYEERNRRFMEKVGEVEKKEHDPWFDLIPTKYSTASMKDFGQGAWEKFDHVARGGSMLMLGPTGVGKTRLLWAMARELASGGIDTAQIKVTTLQKLLARVRTSGADWADEVTRLYGKCVWLFVDECDKVNGSENDLTITSALVDERYQWERATVFAGNGTRESIIQKLGEPVVSRLTAGNEKGKLFMVNGKDRRTT